MTVIYNKRMATKPNYNKEYRNSHQKEIKQYNKEYSDNHKEQAKQYRDNHKEQIKQYRQDNKEQINERANKKHICEICKSIYTYKHKSRHEATNKHIKQLS